MVDKAALRKTMRAARRAMSGEDVRARSGAAQRHVLTTEQWKSASSVALYIAIRNETETSLLLETAWAAGKQVLLPYMEPGVPGIMRLLPCERGRKLTVNGYGIPEPSPEACPRPEESEWIPDCAVVPGVAFDRAGRRLGNGGGYYDRLLAKESMRNVARVGFGYAFQVVAALPVEEWDIPMHAVATEEGVLWP